MEEKISEIRLTSNLLWLTVIFLSVLSCNSENVYDEYKTLSRNGWHKDSTLVFNFEIQDTASLYTLFLNTRNYSDCDFSNLWLKINIVNPEGKIESDLHEIVLADSFGNWFGSGIGDLCDLRVAYQPDRHFSVPGEYHISIGHKMRVPVLKGIRDMGLSVKKLNCGKE